MLGMVRGATTGGLRLTPSKSESKTTKFNSLPSNQLVGLHPLAGLR